MTDPTPATPITLPHTETIVAGGPSDGPETFGHLGIFFISHDDWREKTAAVRWLMARCLVFRAEWVIAGAFPKDGIVYTAHSPVFAPVRQGREWEFYHVRFERSGSKILLNLSAG